MRFLLAGFDDGACELWAIVDDATETLVSRLEWRGPMRVTVTSSRTRATVATREKGDVDSALDLVPSVPIAELEIDAAWHSADRKVARGGDLD